MPRSSSARAPAPAPGPRLELFTVLARTGLFLEALQRECLGAHGLGFAEFSVLRLLQEAPEQRLPPTRLAEQIVRTTGAMTKIVDRLERQGRVRRIPDPADRRGVLVALTPAGDRLAGRAAATYTEGRERILSRIDPAAADQVGEGLATLLEAFERDAGERRAR